MPEPRDADDSPPAAAGASGWRSVLGEFASTGSAAPTGSAARASVVRVPHRAVAPATPLGLQFELRRLTRSDADPWRAPKAVKVTEKTFHPADAHEYRLAVRPVLPNGKGGWIRSNVTWASVNFQTNRLALDPEHQRWFAEFAAVQKATRTVHLGQDAEWIQLDDYASPLLWPLLAQAGPLGIELLGHTKGAAVTVGAAAVVSLDARTTAPSTDGHAGPMVVESRLTIDGRPLPIESAAPIADHGVYTATFGARASIVLAPTALRLTAEERRLLGRRTSVRVPIGERDEFDAEVLPALRRGVQVTSADRSVVLPDPAGPVLVLSVRFEPKAVTRLSWEWEEPQNRGGTVEDASSAGSVSAGSVSEGAGATATAKKDVVSRLERLTPTPPGFDALGVSTTIRGADTAVFTDKTLPALRRMPGVRVDATGQEESFTELTSAPLLAIETLDTERSDWFDLGITVTVDGRTVPFGKLFTALSKGSTRLLLVDRSYLSLAHPAFDRLKALLDEAHALAEWETGPRLSRYQTRLWQDIEELADDVVTTPAWRASVGALLEAGGRRMPGADDPSSDSDSPWSVGRVPRIDVPLSVAAELRPYQRDGLDWLVFLRRHGLGGVLADDMGLGKTLQTLAMIAHAVEEADSTHGAPPKPFLVVAPTSVVSNWALEAERFTPGLVVRTVATTQAAARPGSAGDSGLASIAEGAHVVVTSYALLRLDAPRYAALDWAGLVLDEAQFIKNPASKANEAARGIRAPFVIAITGTPLENSLADLWALYLVVAPGLLPGLRRFREEYERPIGGIGTPRGLRGPDLSRQSRGVGTPEERAEWESKTEGAVAAGRLEKLRSRIRPFLLRRTKGLVASELPEKQEQVLSVELAPAHRELYDAYLQREREKLLGLVTDLDRRRYIMFRSLTLLRLASLDAALVDDSFSHIPSAKLDTLVDRLDEVVAEGRRALVFSQFTTFLSRAAARLDEDGITYSYLDGSTTDRQSVIDGFRGGTDPVFLISLKAGGFGLTLTEADTVFILDPWWNPAAEAQAVDRTHRIGQTERVTVYRLVAAGTIEEKIMRLKERKAALVDSVIDDGDLFADTLTEDDLRELLDD